jgi:hypothetical protein
MKSAGLICNLVLVTALAACAGSTDRTSIEERLLDRDLELGEGNQRIPRYRVNSWSSIDDEYLIVTAGVRDQYLVQLRTPCFNLSSAFSIGFTTPMNQLDRFARIVVRGPGRGREYCDIQDIIRLHPID